MVDRTFVNGIIAVKEKTLLGGRILKMCEGSAEDAFRTLLESGFAHGAELDSVYDYERALIADQKDIDKFIRAYSPSKAVTEYLFAPRDYHNAKALVKAKYLGEDPAKMLAPDGVYPAEQIAAYINGGACGVDGDLKGVIDEAQKLFEGEVSPSGAQVGILFERAKCAHLLRVCKHNKKLKGFLSARSDMTDILTVMRSASAENAQGNLLNLGKLERDKLFLVFGDDEERAERALDGTYLKEFWRLAYACRSKGLPQTEAERILAGLEEKFYKDNKYSSSSGLPFMYYVFKRRAENTNVRIVISCLLAGMEGEAVKARLRSYD